MSNFDHIHRLQEIATIIKESGADIFYAPTTVAYDIECAIKEIERLRRDYSCICNEMRRMMEERDDARLASVRFMEKMADILNDEANAEIEQLRKERDEARREVCHLMRSDDYNEPFDGTVFEYATHRGWDCFKDNP